MVHLQHLVTVMSVGQRGRDVPVLVAEEDTREVDFDTAVAHLAVVDDAGGQTQRGIHIAAHEEVAGMAVVVLDVTAEAAVEDAEVETDVCRRRLLPP